MTTRLHMATSGQPRARPDVDVAADVSTSSRSGSKACVPTSGRVAGSGARYGQPSKRPGPDLPGYRGTKSFAALWTWIINRIPPHHVFVESCLGRGEIWQRIRPARVSIGVELDTAVCEAWRDVAGIRIVNQSCMDWLRRHRAGIDQDWFIYVDPPYLPDRRQPGLYDCEMTIEDHERLLSVVSSLDAYVMVSGYPSELYDVMLSGWETETRRVSYHGQSRTEQIWYNYPRPEVLHDHRYLGEDSQDRRTKRRMVRRWLENLAGMGPAERGQMLQAIGDVYSGRKD